MNLGEIANWTTRLAEGESVGSALSTAEIRDQHSRQIPKSKQVGDGALRKYIYRESVRLEGAGFDREV